MTLIERTIGDKDEGAPDCEECLEEGRGRYRMREVSLFWVCGCGYAIVRQSGPSKAEVSL